MQDLRAAPRWSKTAGIVVLVVFGLVLLVAVFGLLALTSQLDEQRTARQVKARQDGRVLLADVQADVEGALQGVVTRARNLDRNQDVDSWTYHNQASRRLRSFLEGEAHGGVAAWIVRLDSEKTIRWTGGRYVLWMPRDVLRKRAEEDARMVSRQRDLQKEALLAQRSGGAGAALKSWLTLVSNFGLAAGPRDREDPNGPLWPDAMGWAVQMVDAAATTLFEDAESLTQAEIRDVALRALEVESLNALRAQTLPPIKREAFVRAYDVYAQKLAGDMRRLVEHTPEGERDDLLWELAQFRTMRILFGGSEPRGDELPSVLRPATQRSLLDAAYTDARSHAPRYISVVPQARQLFGLHTQMPGYAVVVGLDGTGVDQLVAARLAARKPQFDDLGLVAQRFPAATEPVMSDGTAAAESLELKGAVHLPIQLAVFQTGPPKAAEDESTSVLFWALILLAGAGLSVGGYVLVRLLTREIRLAQLKADFVSNLSHELKTPITSISIFTEMLEDGQLTDPEDQTEAFSVLGQESRRLQRIVTRMIDVARGEARTSPYNLEPGDVNRSVLDAATRFGRIVTEPGLDLAIQLHPGKLVVNMDLQAVDDVVTNLLSNAWKYKRGDQAKVAVRTARRGRWAEIVVEDDGLGIPRADRRKVFDMFFRSEQYLTQPVAGTGLGLALVRSVVAGHKGRVSLEAGAGGVGSRFTVRLPLDRKAQAALAAHEPSTSDTPDAPSHGKVSPS